jgi:peptidoglycan/xylan/chitin deacetylase (PgdA/CDA1 family)
VLASRLPVFLHAVSHFDEAYLALSLAVEGHMLGAHDCLLSESLYGLKRANFDTSSWPAEQRDVAAAMPYAHMAPLTQRDRRKTLLLEAVLPYLKVCCIC